MRPKKQRHRGPRGTFDAATAAPAVLWKEDRDSEVPYVPSPLLHEGRLYVMHDDGAVNHEFSLNGVCFATPVVVRGRLVIRTTAELVAFEVKR